MLPSSMPRIAENRIRILYGRRSTTAEDEASAAGPANWSVPLTLAPLTRPAPLVCTGGMRCGRLGGRTGVTVMPFGAEDEAPNATAFPVTGGFLEVSDGDGDDRIELAPLVWTPAGVGRFAFVGMVGGGTAVTEMGAMIAMALRAVLCRWG